MELADQKCVPCRGDVPRLTGAELREVAARLPGWKIVDEHHIERLFQFPDFVSALEFVRRVGAVAEEQGHHPDIHLTWGRVKISIYTHKIDGLTESDFVLGAKIEREFGPGATASR